MTDHRKPPPPPGGWSKREAGRCNFCGGEVLGDNGTRDRRRNWHRPDQKDCLERWLIANNPAFARVKVFARDFGICSYCGKDTKPVSTSSRRTWEETRERCAAASPSVLPPKFVTLGAWEVEHEFPLWLVDKDAPSAFRYWEMGNLKTCCEECHKTKNAAEAKMRAKGKRIAAQNGLLKKKESKRERAERIREARGERAR